MTEKKHLIVNTDDFGLSTDVNRGIIEAYEKGIVTSASLMVRWSAAKEAAAYGKANQNLSIGLHVDLYEWIYRKGDWMPLYEVVQVDDRTAVMKEVSKPIDIFHKLTGQDPTHIDSHQHVHQQEPVRSILIELARDIKVPFRHFTPEIKYCSGFYGQTTEGSPFPDAISVKGLLKILETLPSGFTELACHPGAGGDLETIYCSEREQEVKVLCDPKIRASIVDLELELCAFSEASKLLASP